MNTRNAQWNTIWAQYHNFSTGFLLVHNTALYNNIHVQPNMWQSRVRVILSKLLYSTCIEYGLNITVQHTATVHNATYYYVQPMVCQCGTYILRFLLLYFTRYGLNDYYYYIT